jgi:hypothetical protein
MYRLRDALDFLGPKVLQLEQIAEKFSCAFSNYNVVRLGDALEASRNVRRLADNRLLLSSARSDQIADYDQSGGNADAGLQWSSRLQPVHRLDLFQPRPDRSLGIILMGLRIAEIDQHAVAHVFRHEPAEPLHSLGDALLISGNDLAQVLRVHSAESAVEPTRSENITVTWRRSAASCDVASPPAEGVAFGAASSKPFRSAIPRSN